MHKNTMKCNKTQSKWCINKHGASKIIDTFEMYQGCRRVRLGRAPRGGRRWIRRGSGSRRAAPPSSVGLEAGAGGILGGGGYIWLGFAWSAQRGSLSPRGAGDGVSARTSQVRHGWRCGCATHGGGSLSMFGRHGSRMLERQL
jgi:hypothetical protein